ncbi:MAG: helix-turn-helix domain-containing protein [Parachlamydiales bacterium]|nr:helix-turn-helix domain-containing protein [Parachlamydiales bacterium]
MTGETNWGNNPQQENPLGSGAPQQPQKRVVSITEAARLNNVTRQAIYVAIKQKKLKAIKDATRWTIDLDDLEDYKKGKYSRTKSMYEGELLFDNKRGYYSVNQVSKMLNVPAQKIYYATRVGHLQAHRKGAAWVVNLEDVKAYKESYLDRRTTVGQIVG